MFEAANRRELVGLATSSGHQCSCGNLRSYRFRVVGKEDGGIVACCRRAAAHKRGIPTQQLERDEPLSAWDID